MISFFILVIFIAILSYAFLKIKLMYDIVDHIEEIKRDIEELKGTKEKNIEKESNTRKRKAVAKVAYDTPLKTYKEYDQYKDKHSGLYEPRRPSRGLKIEEREVE